MVSLASCSGFDDDIKVESIFLRNTDIEISEGESYTLRAVIAPERATNKNIIWASLADSIVSINTRGIVTGVAFGTTTVSATTVDGYKSAYCNVTVKKAAPEFVDFNEIITDETAYFENDGTATLSVRILNRTKYSIDIVGFNYNAQRYLIDDLPMTPTLRLENLGPGDYKYSVFARLVNGETFTSEERTFTIKPGPKEE